MAYCIRPERTGFIFHRGGENYRCSSFCSITQHRFDLLSSLHSSTLPTLCSPNVLSISPFPSPRRKTDILSSPFSLCFPSVNPLFSFAYTEQFDFSTPPCSASAHSSNAGNENCLPSPWILPSLFRTRLFVLLDVTEISFKTLLIPSRCAFFFLLLIPSYPENSLFSSTDCESDSCAWVLSGSHLAQPPRRTPLPVPSFPSRKDTLRSI